MALQVECYQYCTSQVQLYVYIVFVIDARYMCIRIIKTLIINTKYINAKKNFVRIAGMTSTHKPFLML